MFLSLDLKESRAGVCRSVEVEFVPCGWAKNGERTRTANSGKFAPTNLEGESQCLRPSGGCVMVYIEMDSVAGIRRGKPVDALVAECAYFVQYSL